MSKKGNAQKQSTDKGRSVVEWITLGISVLILLVLAGLIVYESTRDDNEPTVIVVEPAFEALRQEQDHYYLPVTVANGGSRTAEGVVVQLTLAGARGEAETASLTVDFLAGGEKVEGVVVFRGRPSAQNVSFVASYLEP